VRIEANIFDFNKDIYGETIEITMVQKLRDEQKFSSLDALKSQLHKDKLDTLRVLGKELG
jgi:FAD synthase